MIANYQNHYEIEDGCVNPIFQEVDCNVLAVTELLTELLNEAINFKPVKTYCSRVAAKRHRFTRKDAHSATETHLVVFRTVLTASTAQQQVQVDFTQLNKSST